MEESWGAGVARPGSEEPVAMLPSPMFDPGESAVDRIVLEDPIRFVPNKELTVEESKLPVPKIDGKPRLLMP